MSSFIWHRLLACVSTVMTGWKPIPLLLVLLVGCTTDTAPKTSHFEHDHFVAPHWPSDLADAASKIRDRMKWIDDGWVPEMHDHDHGHHDHHGHDDHEHDDRGHGDHGHDDHGHDDHDDHGNDDHGHDDHEHEIDPKAEIIEIVSWVAEIAADTDLAESDWLPLYHATESLSANLRSAGGELTNENRQQLESLCELVDQAAAKIPKLLPGDPS